MRNGRSNGGFSLFEMIVVVAFVGILSMTFAPSLLNPTQARSLDAEARTIVASLQLAKWQAGAGKINHRVRFYSQSGRWWYVVEVETSSGTWAGKPGQPAHSVATALTLTLTLPADSSVVFSPTGFVSGYDSSKSQIRLASSKLAAIGRQGRRVIQIFASGSTRMTAESGG
jgi:Tfp pilus assembly protein FimT